MNLSKINKFTAVVYIVFAVCFGIHRITNGLYYHGMLFLLSPLFLLIPMLFCKLMSISPQPLMTCIVYIFCILAFTIGMAFGGYAKIPYYDKIVHGLSGVFFAFAGYIIYFCIKPERKILTADKTLCIYTSFSTAMTSAAIWEIYEYLYSLISKTDPQGVLHSGVGDTMHDIIACGIGAVIFCIIVYIKILKSNKFLFNEIITSIVNK